MSVFNLEAILSLNSKQFEDGLKSAKGLAGSVGSAIGGGLKTLAGVGIKALAGATTAVTGFAAASVKTGMDFDKAMSQVQATMLKTDEEMENEVGRVSTAYGDFEGNLREFAMFLGKNTKFSATEAAEALNYMALAGYDTQESLNMLPSVLSLASAGDFDLARASDMVTDAQTALGLSSERTALMVDEMAKAASSGNTSVEQLGDAFLVVGGLAQELNGGFVETASGAKIYADGLQEMEIALTAMANAGIKGSEGGTHMRNMLTKLSSPTAEGTKALEAMGVTIFDVEGNMRSLTDIMSDLGGALSTMTQEEKIQTISDLFNSRDLASAEALLGAVEQKYVKIGDDIMDMGSAYEKYGDAIYDSTQGFEIVQSSWDELGEKILDAKIPLEDVTKAIDDSGLAWEKYGLTAQDEIDELSASIRHDLSTSGLSVAETAANIAEAYDISLGDATKAVMNVDKALKEATGSAADMANIQLDNLDGDVTIFQSALESAKITVSNELTPALRKFVQFGTQGLSDMVDAFNEDGLSGAMDKFGEILSAGIGQLTEGLPDVIDAGMQLLEALGKGIIENAPVLFNALFEVGGMINDKMLEVMEQAATALADFDFASATKGLMDKVVEALIGPENSFGGGNIEKFMSLGLSITSNLMRGIIEALPVVAEGAVNIIDSLAEGIKTNFPKMLPVAMEMLVNFSSNLRTNAGKLVDSGLNLIMSLAKGIIDGLPTLIQTIPTIVINIAGIINDNAPKILMAGVKLIAQLIVGIVKSIPTLIQEFPKIIEAIVAVFTAFNWLSLGTKLITGIVNGVKSLSTSLPNTLKSIGQKAFDFVKNIDWKTLGATIINFIKNGISGLSTAIPNALKQIALNAFELVKNIDWLGLGKAIIDGIVAGLWKFAGSFWDAITGILQRGREKAEAHEEIHSPSKKYEREVGRNISLGIANGILKEEDTVANALKDVTDLVDAPYATAKIDTVGTVSGFSNSSYSENAAESANENLAEAFVKALDKYGLTVQVDNREFGRVVRREVMA